MSASSAELEAARVLLATLGISPADLLTSARHRVQVPTFGEYIPVVSAAVTAGTRRIYGAYWNRIRDQWADRRLDEPTPSDIKALVEYVRTSCGCPSERARWAQRRRTPHLRSSLPLPAR